MQSASSSTITRATLVRRLAQWGLADAPAGERDLAERLGQWVGAFDAIGLQATNRSLRQAGGMRPFAPVKPPGALAEAFEQARGTLAGAIARDAALPNEFSYAPYQRRHLELQRQMEQVVGTLREHLREKLARSGGPLQQLATLDAALERAVAAREQSLLRALPGLLGQRFQQLRQAHLQARKAEGGEDDPMTWRRPGAWLHAFEADWQQALRAELELRLEPAAGLVEAGGDHLDFPR